MQMIKKNLNDYNYYCHVLCYSIYLAERVTKSFLSCYWVNLVTALLSDFYNKVHSRPCLLWVHTQCVCSTVRPRFFCSSSQISVPALTTLHSGQETAGWSEPRVCQESLIGILWLGRFLRCWVVGFSKPGLGCSRVQLWSQRTRCAPQGTSWEEWGLLELPCRLAGQKSVHVSCDVCTSCDFLALSLSGESPLQWWRWWRSGECCWV